MQSSPVDFQWLADRTSLILLDLNENSGGGGGGGEPAGDLAELDPWVRCISVFMSCNFVMGHCPTAVSHAWPLLFARLQALWPNVDPA